MEIPHSAAERAYRYDSRHVRGLNDVLDDTEPADEIRAAEGYESTFNEARLIKNCVYGNRRSKTRARKMRWLFSQLRLNQKMIAH